MVLADGLLSFYIPIWSNDLDFFQTLCVLLVTITGVTFVWKCFHDFVLLYTCLYNSLQSLWPLAGFCLFEHDVLMAIHIYVCQTGIQEIYAQKYKNNSQQNTTFSCGKSVVIMFFVHWLLLANHGFTTLTFFFCLLIFHMGMAPQYISDFLPVFKKIITHCHDTIN